MKFSNKLFNFPCATTLLFLLVAGNALAFPVTSNTDLFEGANIVSSSGTIGAGFTAANMFKGGIETDGATTTIFNNVGAGNSDSVIFRTVAPVAINGINLSLTSDFPFNGYARAISNFQFWYDSNGDMTVDTMLVNSMINPAYADLILTYNFGSTINSSYYRAVFTQANNILNYGLRVVELDAIDAPPAPTPEPATMLLLGSGIAGLVGLKRRRSSSLP